MSGRDPYLEQLIAEADRLLREHDYTAALEVLDRADKDFPHQRDVLARREACIKNLGRKSFAFGKEQKEKVAFDKIADAVRWDAEPIVETSNEPVRKFSWRAVDFKPSMVDPLEFDPNPPASSQRAAKTSLQWLPLGLLALYILATLYIAQRGPAPGEVRTFAGVRFVWIPPAATSALRDLEVDPDDQATLRTGFWLSQTEISIPDWERIVNDRTVDLEGFAPLPKTGVSFTDAEHFAQLLSRTGEGRFRLPTASEWRWASLAGRRTNSPLSENELNRSAWHADTSDGVLHSVAELEPTPWSLHDILGNAEEWVDTPPSGDAYQPPNYYRLLMGGSYRTFVEIMTTVPFIVAERNVPLETAGIRILREPASQGSVAQRVLQFPADVPVGVLYVNGEPHGEAIGDVAVFEDDEVSLVVHAGHPADLGGLRGIKGDDLFALSIDHPDVPASAFVHLAGMTELTELSIARAQASGALGFLHGYTAIERLALNSAGVLSADLQSLRAIPTLRGLSLRGNPGIDSSAVDTLSALRQLEQLDVSETALTGYDLVQIQLALPFCEMTPQPTEFTQSERLNRASLGGSLKLLLHQFRPLAPPERAFIYDGFQKRPSYAGQRNLHPGYWVYVDPHWYVWFAKGELPAPGSSPWSAANLVGEPAENFATPGRAEWAPAAHNNESHWLLVEFAEFLRPSELEIHWTTEPRPVQSVRVFSEEGDPIEFAVPGLEGHTAWGQHNIEHLAATTDFLTQHRDLTVNRIHIAFEPVEDAAQEEPPYAIDAVSLTGRSGRTQWAVAAAASSSYVPAAETTSELNEVPHRIETVEVNPPRFRGFLGLIESWFSAD